MATQPEKTDRPFQDYYEILHLHPDADAAMVDQAYWHLARLYNAAVSSDASAKAKLDDLNDAYSVLRSPALRKEYDQVRNAVLGEGALPKPPQPDPEPPPLPVMAKQRPKPRKEKKPKRPREPRFRIQQVSVPTWQGAAGALVVLVLASTALVADAQPVLVIALLVLGLAFATVPLVRRLPRLPAPPTPTLHLPTLRAPRFPERSGRATLDPDALRQSTEAMVSRWRVGTEGLSNPGSPLPLTPRTSPPEPRDDDQPAPTA